MISTKLRISSSWMDLKSVNWAQDKGQLNMMNVVNAIYAPCPMMFNDIEAELGMIGTK